MAPKTTIALIYDFDKTLCTRDMQEYGFIPNIGVKAKDFWKRSAELTAELGMDSILAYMYTMVRSAQAARKAIRR
ncbi:MAG: haloacid dehalogenase-like hydrolase, partial [Thermoguttaceae bacterium]|nr:haloacid dehalogenase-like hydrolase [Thermoguttaceae bacterium]